MCQQNDFNDPEIYETSIWDTWKALTHEGNVHFHQEDYMKALDSYEHARRLILEHFEYWDTPDNALAALVVSYLNLADCQQRLGRNDEAADTLCMAHDRLVMTSCQTTAAPALREAACRHQRETFAALTQFMHARGQDSRWSPLLKACLVRTQPHMQLSFEACKPMPEPASRIH